MTPDNYTPHVLDLINSATSKLYFQNQYIKIGSPGTNLDQLVKAIAAKVADGLDVRIILRDLGAGAEDDARAMLTGLAQNGVPSSVVKLQRSVHNKGIVVDSEVVMISSQNWSMDGTDGNRDAGLIIFNADVAKYYEQVFLHDWDVLAKQKVLTDTAMPVIAPLGAPTPPNMVRMAWADFYHD